MVSVGFKVSVVMALVILILPVFAPVVAASPRGQLQSVTKDWYVAPNPNVNWSALVNIANQTQASPYTSRNATWNPYFENFTDSKGILISPSYPPNILGRTIVGGYENWTIIQNFRPTADMIMDGVSETWLRLPVGTITPNASITIRLWRSEVSANNVTDISGLAVEFSIPSAINLIFNDTVDYSQDYINTTTSYNSTYGLLRWLNVSVTPGYDLNFTYFKMCAPLFPNEWYFLGYTITDPWATEVELFLTNSDMFEDNITCTWMNWNSDCDYLTVETDYSMVFIKGMSNGFTGTPTLPIISGDYTRVALRSNVTYVRTIEATDYLNVVIPVVTEPDAAFPLTLNISLYLYEPDDTFISSYSAAFNLNGTQDRVIFCPSLAVDVGESLGRILVQLTYNYTDMNKVHFFLQASDSECEIKMIYWHLSGTPLDFYYTTMYRGSFMLFAQVYIDDSYWFMTDYDIIVLPVEHPETEMGIVEAYQKWKAYITPPDGTLPWWMLPIWLYMFLGTVWGVDSLLEDLSQMFSDFINWLLGPGSLLNKLWNFLKGIGHFISQVIEFVVEALEWFCYWGVRIIYAFSVALVYMVNVYAVISINTGLLALSRTGNGKDLIKAFGAGWKFIFAIISLMLSLMILAISIVSAVIPF